jgi:DNA polymerase-3 subunit epsilon
MQPLAFVDLETTGATATVDRITEIGIVEVDADGMREWSRLVNPERSIPGFIQNMTGITDAMVRAAPTFDEVAAEVLERLKGRLFIAHNAPFDYGFLKSEFRRVGHDFRATVLCTVKLSRRLFPEHRRHSLDALIERHGLRADGRHRALADAQLIHQFWQQLRQSQPEDHLAALIKELTARPSLPAHLDPGIVDELPESPGVYLLYGENALPLYVGKAKDIKKRVLAHFAGDHASAAAVSLAQQVRRIDWIVTGGEIGAQIKQALLIKQWQPVRNRQPRRDSELGAIAMAPWPFAGPAGIKEGDEVHVVDGWCYLGSAKSEDGLWSLLDQQQPEFDRDIYRILVKAAARLVPLQKTRP